ncbi:ATP-dependent Clp protease proteolytic subunit [Massilia sp. CCM 8734]|uniref:ATP-dependent Clp protease proteolytic subunit n=1 Tax=Massilia sp. CCM 8734 TaxID=2609283 RepID=UPI0014220839|nr:ATP-dependent Clp protease proteolytic subunit [Massilia sp. CCM 8734]NIA00765.1 hypothetical protein [Massilia sp. CCM 8734]
MSILNLAFATALALSIGMAHAAYTPSALRATGIPLTQLVLYDQSNATITVIGEITPTLLQSFRAQIVQHPDVTQLYIDSGGGTITSAIDMARILYERDISLVVDGRCLSACANFLFAAARRKSVLPGSIIGIHETTVSYVDQRAEDIPKSTSGHEADKVLRPALSADHLKQWNELQRKEKDFYRDFGIRQDLHSAYANYVSNRKKLLGVSNIDTIPGNLLCPRLRSWALSKDQLVWMGVKGIDRFWFPQNDMEKQRLSKTLGLSPDSLYVGSSHNLQQYCTGFSKSGLARQWYGLRTLIKGL